MTQESENAELLRVFANWVTFLNATWRLFCTFAFLPGHMMASRLDCALYTNQMSWAILLDLTKWQSKQIKIFNSHSIEFTA